MCVSGNQGSGHKFGLGKRSRKRTVKRSCERTVKRSRKRTVKRSRKCTVKRSCKRTVKCSRKRTVKCSRKRTVKRSRKCTTVKRSRKRTLRNSTDLISFDVGDRIIFDDLDGRKDVFGANGGRRFGPRSRRHQRVAPPRRAALLSKMSNLPFFCRFLGKK